VVAFVATAPGSAASRGGDLTVTRTQGQTEATLVYRRLQALGPGDDYFADGRIRISRVGVQLFRERVPLDPRLEHGSPVPGETRGFSIRDLDGDSEPEVMLQLDSGGAHCCSWTRVYRYAGGRYSPVAHFWGNASSAPTLEDVDGDARPEFVSTDDRFAYDFNG